MAKKILIVAADYNDGDYVTKESPIMDKELSKLKAILKKVEKDKYNKIRWETGYVGNLEDQHKELTEEEKEYLDDYCPHGENGIHTIASIRVLEILSDKELLK